MEAFETLARKRENASSVLNKLKEQFDLRSIHVSLIDLLEHEHLDKAKHTLVAKMLDLMHTEEGLPPCGEHECEHEREKLQKILNKK